MIITNITKEIDSYLESLDLPDTHNNRHLVLKNIFLLKRKQDLYTLLQTYPGLMAINTLDQLSDKDFTPSLSAIDFPPPPLQLIEAFENHEEILDKLGKDYSVLVRSTDNFSQFQKFNAALFDLIEGRHHEIYKHYTHKDENHTWFSIYNITTPLTWIFRFMLFSDCLGVRHNYMNLKLFLDAVS